MFVEVDKTVRTCSSCGETKDVSKFYKDGKTSSGEPRYRRDCKDCYRVTRLSSRRRKAPKPISKPTSKHRKR